MNGTLDVRGTTSSLAYFTSIHDDSAGGDTNGNGTGTSPSAGKWGQITVNSSASTTLNGIVVRYGGNVSSTQQAMVYNGGGKLNVRYADLSYSGKYGIFSASGTSTVTDAQIHNNDDGVGVNGGYITVASSSIFNNTIFGASQMAGPTSTMENNFWGGWSPLDYIGGTYNSGPYNTSTNPNGKGDEVSSYIDYDPYVVAYLAHPNASNWSPPGVNTNVSAYEMRVGSSTQYQIQLDAGIDTWNSSSSGYVNIVKASSSPSSTWDIYVKDINNLFELYTGKWVPSTTSTPYIVFNSAYMGSSSTVDQCVTTHELGHALGLAHSPDGNIEGDCDVGAPTTLSAQDLHDFNMLWSSPYFFDPHKMKGIIQ